MAAAPAIARKVVIIGPFSVGKTSLVRRHVENEFDGDYRATLGVACSTKDVALSDGRTMKQVIWDVEGGLANAALFQSYLRGAGAALLVADLSRPETFDDLPAYFTDLQKICPGIPIAVALNKSDLVSADEIENAKGQIGRRFGNLVRATSAATGAEVEQLFIELGDLASASGGK